MHNHEADSEACLNRQMLNNSVKRKAMVDLCERPRKLTHKELQRQYLDNLTYKDIKKTLEGTRTEHAPPNCLLFQQILKKHMKH